MPYRWMDVSFTAPEGRDESTVVIVDVASPPSWNLTARADELPGGDAAFAAYVAAQKPAEGVAVDQTTERVVAGRKTVIVDQHLRVDRQIMRQQQALVLDGTRVLVVTITYRETAAVHARKAFATVLDTLTWT